MSYPYLLMRADEGGWVALHPELPGCVAQGETIVEAVDSLDDAREMWLSVHREDGLPIEEPVEKWGPLLERMQLELLAVTCDERFSYPNATIDVNAPLALIQMNLEARYELLRTLYRVIGRDLPPRESWRKAGLR